MKKMNDNNGEYRALRGKVTVASVDYERSIQGLFPLLLAESGSAELHMLVRSFLSKMDGDLLPIILNIVGYMSRAEKDALLLWALDNYKRQLINMLLQVLRDNGYENAVRIEKLDIVKTEASVGMAQVDFSVQIDHGALVENRPWILQSLVKNAARFAQAIGVSLLNIQFFNEKMIKSLTEKLQETGLYLKIQDIELEQDEKDVDLHVSETIDMEADQKPAGFDPPEAIGESLVNAVVNYLKDTKAAGFDQ